MNLLYFIISLFLIGCGQNQTGSNGDTSDEPVLTLTVHADSEQQTIHGFGASDAWSIQFVGENWPLEKRNQIADLLFSSEVDPQGNPTGIGLSLWRFNIGAGSARQGVASGISDPWRRAESFLSADSTYDWNKQQGQQWFMKAAKERGVEKFVGFVNSPPVILTTTGKAYGDGSDRANIKPDYYDEFAEYLTTIAAHFKQEGIAFDYLSPVNEPQWDWAESNGQEGSPWRNNEISDFLIELDDKIRKYNLNTQIEIPETAQIDYIYGGDLEGRSYQADYFFGQESRIKELPSLANKFAAHSYFTTWPVEQMVQQRSQVWQNIQQADNQLEYWMSEYCILANNEEIEGNGRDLGMDPALYVVRVMHFDLTVANASSWQWWLGVSPYDYKDGLVYIDKKRHDGQIYDSKLLWGLGNFSRFIRPGAVRLEVSRSDNLTPAQTGDDIMASAYLHKKDSRVTIVAVNYSSKSREIEVNMEGLSTGQYTELVPYVTSEDANLQKQTIIEKGELLSIPARSIVTLTGNLN